MRFSLKKKATLLIISIVLLVSAVSLLCCGRITMQIVQRQFMGKTVSMAQTISAVVNTSEVRELRETASQIYERAEEKAPTESLGVTAYDAYLSQFQDVEKLLAFHHIQGQLQAIQQPNGLTSAYLFFVDPAHGCMVYLVDASLENSYPPGCVREITGSDQAVFADPTQGFPPSINETAEHEQMVTAAQPIYDRNGAILAYAGVGLPMTSVHALVNHFILLTALALAILSAVLCLISVLLVDRAVVKPINTLSNASVTYCSQDASTIRHKFSQLQIKTGDEIQTLAESMAQMERDINEHIANLLSTTQELASTREHAEQLDTIASVDALTKVRNKRAYDQEIARVDRGIREGRTGVGLAMIDLNNLKRLNDTYGHEKGDIAIQTLCSFICITFHHSPVFRIGGDEFAVILENRDYENAQVLIEQFKQTLLDQADDPDLPPWEAISAAIGYAALDPKQDSSMATVFKRADTAMYDNKRIIKASLA